MLLQYRLMLGGPVGGGRQWISWIHIDDMVRLYRYVIEQDGARGALNATAPEPVRQSVFAKSLGRALRRPPILPTPGFAIKTFLGEMGKVLLLEGQKVLPRETQALGFSFEHPSLDTALNDIIQHGK
jgi:uncharacterized protein (TIGR01777 family)